PASKTPPSKAHVRRSMGGSFHGKNAQMVTTPSRQCTEPRCGHKPHGQVVTQRERALARASPCLRCGTAQRACADRPAAQRNTRRALRPPSYKREDEGHDGFLRSRQKGRSQTPSMRLSVLTRVASACTPTSFSLGLSPPWKNSNCGMPEMA